MTKVSKKSQKSQELNLEVKNANAAGIDISATEHQVCVPSDRDSDSNRTFGVYTDDLHKISDWLKKCRIQTVAMESTGIYWGPIFRVLIEDGFDVVLVNAYDVKNFSGRKTDASDAEWLMVLHSYGLLRPCHQLDNATREIRDLIRLRTTHVRSASREVLHVQKAMEQMNLKLDNVFSDILGKSGQAIINAILSGERDSKKLASLADSRCHKSKEEIEQSLHATWDKQYLFAMRQNNEAYKFYLQQIDECDEQIEKTISQYVNMQDKCSKVLVRSKKRRQKKSSLNFDIERQAQQIWHTNAMLIPGINEVSLLGLLGELGTNFTKDFPTVKQFVSWANLVPNNKISGGALLSSKVPKKQNPVGIIFRICANTQQKAANSFGYFFRHMKAKGGHKYAIVATAKKIATIFYNLVKNEEDYNENTYIKNRKTILENKIEFYKRKLEKMEQEYAVCL